MAFVWETIVSVDGVADGADDGGVVEIPDGGGGAPVVEVVKSFVTVLPPFALLEYVCSCQEST